MEILRALDTADRRSDVERRDSGGTGKTLNLEAHVSVMRARRIKCVGCARVTDPSPEEGVHDECCPFSFANCSRCGRSVMASQMTAHQLVDCPARLTCCGHCGLVLSFSERAEHQQAYIVMAYIVMAYIFMSYIVMVYIVMAYIVMVLSLSERAEHQQACAFNPLNGDDWRLLRSKPFDLKARIAELRSCRPPSDESSDSDSSDEPRWDDVFSKLPASAGLLHVLEGGNYGLYSYGLRRSPACTRRR